MAKPTWLGNGTTAAVAVLAAYAIGVGACGTEETPRRGSGISPTTSGSGGSHAGGGPSTGACEGDEIQSCKVQIDENNCFVGEQQCAQGEWGPCVDPEKLDTAALGPISDCPNNPCNPWCQQFGGETPAAPIEAAGSAAPAGGTIAGLPSSWQSAGITEPCAGPADCQYDTHCVAGSCVPWPYPDWDATNMAVDLTAPVQCDSTYVTVCNRGAVAVPNGTDVLVGVFDASAGDFGTCAPTSTLHSSCTWSNGIAPGQCVNVTGCDVSGTKNVYVNYDDPVGTAVAESSCANNWSVRHAASGCSCTNVSSSGSLQQVNIYFLLDNSGSMGGPTQSCYQSYCTDSWDGVVPPIHSFIDSAGAAPLRLAFRVFDQPNSNCDHSSCSASACEQPLYGPEFLSVATHRQDIHDWLNLPYSSQLTARTPHGPALRGARTRIQEWNTTTFPGERNVLVYISDGQGDSCGYSNPQNEVSGIEAYAIAMPGSDINLLNSIASVGGTGSAYDLRSYTGAALATQLTNTLTAIQAATASCTVTVDNAGQVDFNNLSISWTPTVGTMVTLAEVMDAAACDMTPPADVMEYYLTPAGSPTDVELCSPACTTVQGDVTGTLQILGQCIGGYTSQTYGPEAYEASCASIGSGHPRWDFLLYDTTQVGDSSIEFQMRTGNTAAEAATGAWTTVATATLAEPDRLGGNPVDIEAVLGPLAQQAFLEVQFVINPTLNGSATPQLLDWSLQYTCADSE